MIIGVPKETAPTETRSAMVPANVAKLVSLGAIVQIETGAGKGSGFPEEAFAASGATIIPDRAQLLAAADILLRVRKPPLAEVDQMKSGAIHISFLDPFKEKQLIEKLAARGISAISLEMLPRITRAQKMDALTSQANLAGYVAAVLAAAEAPKIFPLMMTAAGTISPARVLVIGAGVAGLQAIATAKRLGAVVSGYDVRPAVKEQVESLGARFVQLELEGSEGAGGYAAAMDEAFYARQAELMTPVVAAQDVVITTAAVPGQKAPILVTRQMVESMQSG